MPKITVTWNSLRDKRTCHKCASLHGWSWMFIDEMPSVLEDARYGVVWDFTADQSRIHGLKPYNCRCGLVYEIDDSDLTDDLMQLDNEIAKLDANMARSLDYITQFVFMLEGLI